MIAQFYVKKFRQGKVLQSWGPFWKVALTNRMGMNILMDIKHMAVFTPTHEKMTLIKVMGVYSHTHSQTSVILFIRK